MKKIWLIFMALILSACTSGPSLKPADFSLPDTWKAAVSVTDTASKKGRIVFFDENGEISSAETGIALMDDEHPLPESQGSIWLTPGFTDKDMKPEKRMVRLSKNSSEAEMLSVQTVQFTAASEENLWFAKTDGGTPSVVTLDRMNIQTLETASMECEGIQVRALGANENGVCLVTAAAGQNLTAVFYDEGLNEITREILVERPGNVFSCMCGEKMILAVWHLEGQTPCRTLFELDPGSGAVIRHDLPFSKDGQLYAQDERRVLLAESQERDDVLLVRYDIVSGMYEEYSFSGTFRSLAADEESVYLLDQDGIIHILDGNDLSAEVNSFAIAHSESESVRTVFAKH